MNETSPQLRSEINDDTAKKSFFRVKITVALSLQKEDEQITRESARMIKILGEKDQKKKKKTREKMKPLQWCQTEKLTSRNNKTHLLCHLLQFHWIKSAQRQHPKR